MCHSMKCWKWNNNIPKLHQIYVRLLILKLWKAKRVNGNELDCYFYQNGDHATLTIYFKFDRTFGMKFSTIFIDIHTNVRGADVRCESSIASFSFRIFMTF